MNRPPPKWEKNVAMDFTERPRQADRSIPELLRQLGGDTATLVRQELQLARSETLAKLESYKPAAVAGGVAVGFALLALFALTATLVAALAEAMPVWVAASIVTIVYALIAVAGFARARGALERAAAPVPERTIDSVRKDVEAVRAGVRRGR